jgi:hypothetical protein
MPKPLNFVGTMVEYCYAHLTFCWVTSLLKPNSCTWWALLRYPECRESDMPHAAKQGKVTRHNAWEVKLTEHMNEDGLRARTIV